MKIKLICIGKIKEKYLNEGIAEFLKRLKTFVKIEIIELTETKIADNPSVAQIEEVIKDEGLKISKHLNKQDFLVVLDVKGKLLNNYEYVKMVDKACLNGYSTFSFVIGGSYGLSDEIKQASKMRWSFSNLTFTHQMMRLLLLEQIYRGFKIMNNEPYHK